MRTGFLNKQRRSNDLKKMSRHNATIPAPLAEEIRRQIGSPGVTRYLASLPTFSVDPGLPERLSDLLGELRRAEARGRGRKGG